MSLLNVSALQNVGAGQPNILLNVDGSVTLPVYSNSSTPPTPAQAGTLWFNGTNLQIRNLANSAWVSGGGSGVAAITGTLPIAITGTATNPIIAVNAATTALPGSVQLADGAASAAGTSATLVNTPAFSVPKDAAGMTGAALLPTGTQGQRPTPVGGMLRMNTDLNPDSLEVYSATEAAWKQIAYEPKPATLPADVTVGTGAQTLGPQIVANNFTVTAGAVITPSTAGVIIVAYGDVTINASTWNFTGTGPQGGQDQQTTTLTLGNNGNGYGGGRPQVGDGGGIAYAPSAFLGGSGGGAGANTGGSLGNSAGGNGGGYIVIKCFGNLTFNGAVIMNAKGSNATSVGEGGAGGGGGGHICIYSAGTLTSPATVTFDVSGGNATTGVRGTGTGGGGGGWVILETPNLVDSSVKTLTGGLGTSGAAPNNALSGGGGGSAGRGGNTGGFGAGAGQNGGVGIFSTTGFPF
jgi:hypothetical protein